MSSGRLGANRGKALFVLAGLSFSAVFLWLAVRNADLAAVKEELQDADVVLVALAVCVLGCGYLLQAIDQQPYLQGYETINWLFLNSQYKLAPGGDIFTGPGIIDASNVAAIEELVKAGYR